MTETPGMEIETLAQRMARGPLEPQVALDILKRLLKGLALRHWSGAAHGRITPKAIVIDPDGRVTLMGPHPGQSADAPASDLVAVTGHDPRYMAPEQMAGVPADARADVFAVGVIAYEMLTGEHPFGADKGLTGRQVMAEIVSAPSPRIPPALNARLPAYVEPALDIALAKNPEDRFANAEGFLEALRDPEPRDEPVEAPAARRSRPPWFRYYALPAAMAVVVVVVVVLVLTCAGGSSDLFGTTGASGITGAGTSTSPSTGPLTNSTATTAPPTTTTVLSTSTTLRPAPPRTTRYEETVPSLAFTGTWIAGTNASYSAGRMVFANAAGATVTISFSGTYLAWVAKKSPAYGTADVTVDGTTTYTVDLYDPATLYQQKVWDTGILPQGPHTVTIKWTGAKDPAAGDTNIGLDAVDVSGTLR